VILILILAPEGRQQFLCWLVVIVIVLVAVFLDQFLLGMVPVLGLFFGCGMVMCI